MKTGPVLAQRFDSAPAHKRKQPCTSTLPRITNTTPIHSTWNKCASKPKWKKKSSQYKPSCSYWLQHLRWQPFSRRYEKVYSDIYHSGRGIHHDNHVFWIRGRFFDLCTINCRNEKWKFWRRDVGRRKIADFFQKVLQEFVFTRLGYQPAVVR